MHDSLFVGRRTELDALDAALRDARDGRGRLVLLEGEPGIGKTRLATEIVARAEKEGAKSGVGRAWDGGGAPPWFVWSEALRPLGIELALPKTISSDEARFVALQELAERLRALTSETPAVLVLDDVQWADVPSLLALRFVARGIRAAGARLLLIGTVRAPDESAPNVREQLDAIRREALVLRLTGLGEDDLGALARGVGVESRAAGAALAHATGGNALYAHEILLEAESLAALATGAAPSLPRSLASVLDRRLARITPVHRAIIAVAALDGAPVVAADVAVAADTSAENASLALATAESSGLMIADRGAAGDARAERRFRFAHDLIRSAAAASVPATELHARHGAWARALSAYGDARLGDVAMHSFAADPSGTSEAAADAAIAAARRARSKLAFEEAAALAERAVRAHERAGREASLGRALALLSAARFDTGNAKAGAEAAERALAIGRTLDDVELCAESALALGRRRLIAQSDRPLAAVLEDALARLERFRGEESRRTALRCALTARLASALQPDVDPDRALALARGAIATARATGDPEIYARTLYAARPAFRILDDLDERLGLDRELLDLAERLGDNLLVAEAHHRLLKEVLEAGDAQLVDAHADAYERVAAKLRSADHELGAASARVVLATIRGDFAGARERIAKLEATREAWAPRLVSPAPMDPLVTLRACIASASRVPAELQEICVTVSKSRAPRFIVQIIRALFSARAGALEQARADYELNVHLATEGPPSFMVWTQLAEVCVALRDRAHAPTFYELLRGYSGRHLMWLPFWAYDGAVDRLLGGLAALCGREDVARAHYAQAIAAEEAAGAIPFAARTRDDRDAVLGTSAAPPSKRDLDVTREPASKRAPDEKRAPTPRKSDAARPSFTREGDTWVVALGDESTRVNDADGLHYLSLLVSRPDVPVSALELLASRSGRAADDVTEAGARAGDAGEMLDERAIASYRARARDLREELEDAQGRNDRGAVEAARAELSFLERELSRAVGLGGRNRRAASDAERARVNVTMRIRKIIARLRESTPALADHLARSVRTGATCVYSPPVTS
jgi:hypothetical protein